MYAALEEEARNAGLPLRWPLRLPNTRRALAAAEWTRRHQPDRFPHLLEKLFAAHFAHGEDLGDDAVIDRYARESRVEIDALHASLEDGSAEAAVAEAERLGRRWGVHGTPAWLVGRRLISGLPRVSDFERIANGRNRSPQCD